MCGVAVQTKQMNRVPPNVLSLKTTTNTVFICDVDTALNSRT